MSEKRDIEIVHSRMTDLEKSFSAHAAAEEVWQEQIKEAVDCIPDVEKKLVEMEAQMGQLMRRLDEHLEESRELSRSFKKSLWGALTVTLGAVVGLAWEWLKQHIILGKPPTP